jgi:hypothetical protein
MLLIDKHACFQEATALRLHDLMALGSFWTMLTYLLESATFGTSSNYGAPELYSLTKKIAADWWTTWRSLMMRFATKQKKVSTTAIGSLSINSM